MSEQRVKEIARAEVKKEVTKFMVSIDEKLAKQQEVLARLERLLLGELGVAEEDTLKARATFAYSYAKRNTDLGIIEKAIPALEWFDSWNKIQPGCAESKLESLGKLISLYGNIKWLLGLIGITTAINAIPVIKWIIALIQDAV